MCIYICIYIFIFWTFIYVFFLTSVGQSFHGRGAWLAYIYIYIYICVCIYMRALGCGGRVYYGSYTHNAHTKCLYLPCVLLSTLLNACICNGFQLHETKRLYLSSFSFYVYLQLFAAIRKAISNRAEVYVCLSLPLSLYIYICTYTCIE